MTEAREIVVIGASAGGIDALTRLVARLPDELEAAVFVVVHIPAEESMLPAILGRETALIVKAAEDGEPILCNRIYVAPPDCHLLIEPGRIRLSGGPKESGHRPAIDPLFRSAASAYRERVLGVILSGTLDDGSVGLRFPSRDSAALGAVLEQVLTDDAMRAQVVSEAREHILRFDWVEVARRTTDIYTELVQIPLRSERPSTKGALR